MNTPNDASDTAINRLFDDAAEAGATKVNNTIAAVADVEAKRAVGEQFTDLMNYLALVSDIKINQTQERYVRDCLSCCFYKGMYFGITREPS